MAKERSWLRNRLEYGAVRTALATMAVAPVPLAFRLGKFYASILDRAIPRLRRVALDNLSIALPDLLLKERGRVADGMFSSIGRILATFAKLPRITSNNIDRWIRCEGLEHVHAGLARRKGLIFATGHLGNWELSAFAFALLERPIHIVVRPLDNPLLDQLVDRYRELSGNRSINKRDYARSILQALGRNEMVGILADQRVHEGVFIDFFGVPASTSLGIARIAAKSGAAIVPGFALWSDMERKYVLRFFPEIETTGDALAGTQCVQSAIESVIRQYPDQWLWIHRRWKS